LAGPAIGPATTIGDVVEHQHQAQAQAHSRYPHLLAPLEAGRLRLKNRVVFPGHQTLLSEAGVVGDRMLGYYAERAKGGVAAVIVEGAAVHPTTIKFTDYLRAYDERIVPSLDRLADRLHEYGCRAILQLAHSGSRMSTFDSRRELWAPSPVQAAISPEIPHEMTRAEIGELLGGYRTSVANAARSRIDGIEIHAAHEYLLGEFLSPYNNRRTDQYGGSFDKRLRLLLEVIEVARETAGDELVIGVRMNGTDLTPEGVDLDDYVRIAERLAATGAIDYLNISAGTSRDNNRIVPSMEWAQGLYVDHAARIKAAVDIPVIAVGRIKRPAHAEAILADGRADAVAEARALIADPFWVAKAGAGPERIRPCIGCNQGCFGFLYGNHPISCTVNPAVGLERTLGAGTEPRHAARRVLVVGGGPAGMEAAIASAELGHDVVLCEAADALGGQIPAAASIPTRAELREVVDFQQRELGRLGVDVRLGTRVDATLLDAFDAEVVVVAAGSRPPAELLPGDGSLPLWTPRALMDAADHDLPEGPVVVVDGVGHFPAYAPAERLVDAGRQVVVVTAALAPAGNLDQSTMLSLLRRLAAKGVSFVTGLAIDAVDGGRLIGRDVLAGDERSLDARTVVVARGDAAEDSLARALEGGGREVHVIGDALAPRTMLHAIREGRLVVRRFSAVGRVRVPG